MKKVFTSLLLSITLLASFSQTNHTITIGDATIDFDNTKENLGEEAGRTAYLTWDATNLYIGIVSNPIVSTYSNLYIVIDTDPQLNADPRTGNGRTDQPTNESGGATYPFNADLVYQFFGSGSNDDSVQNPAAGYKYSISAGNWTNLSIASGVRIRRHSTDITDLEIPWSDLGISSGSNFNIIIYVANNYESGSNFAQWPTGNNNVTNPILKDFYGYTRSTGVTANSNLHYSFREDAPGYTSPSTNFGRLYFVPTTNQTYIFNTLTSLKNLHVGTNAIFSMGTNSSALTVEENVSISSGTLTLSTLSGGDLNLKGDFSNIAGTLNHNSRTVTFDGTSNQNLFGSVEFSGLILSGSGVKNVSSGTVSLNSVNGSATINPGVGLTASSGADIDFNGRSVTIKSTSSGTGFIGTVADANNSGTDGLIDASNVTVERFIGTPSVKKAWRLLTAPLSGSSGNTVQSNWQTTTNISGPTYPGSGNFSFYSPGYSLKSFNLTNQTWDGVTNTASALQFNSSATASTIPYFIYVRGDTTVTTGSATTATLKATGTLLTGTQTFTATPGTGKYWAIGNPYTSPVDFNLISRSSNVMKRFWFWDPYLNSIGGWVLADDTDDGNGTYSFTPIANTLARMYDQNDKLIQSGQAFFVFTTDGNAATVTFDESNKSTTSNNNPFRTAAGVEKMNISLMYNNAVLDGISVEYAAGYDNAVNFYDATKPANTNESLAVLRNNTELMLERRATINNNDTVFLKLWQTVQATYQFKFEPLNFGAGLSAYLEDSYLNTTTPINLNLPTVINFTINSNALSQAANRFRIIFHPSSVLPVTFTSIKAYQKNGNNVQLEWNVANESAIKHYEVETSTNGRSFTKAATVTAKGNNNSSVAYTWLDANAVNGVNYYRIKSTGLNGDVKYTSVVSVKIGKGGAEVSTYPNPVKGNTVSVQFSNMEKGSYTLRLFNVAGQVVMSRTIQHFGGSASEQLTLPEGIATGNYQLEVNGSKNKYVHTIIIQ